MLQIIVVGMVALGIFLYLRSVRLAKENWLKKLDLPGLWYWQAQQDDDQEGQTPSGQGKQASLTLTGGMDKGRFVSKEFGVDGEAARIIEGEWQLKGHRLELSAPGYRQSLDITLYQVGSIGLEDETGNRRAYVKESTNVVPLKQ